VTTLAVTLRLVARPSLSNYVAGEFARVLFKTKAKLVATLPQVNQLAKPRTPTRAPPSRSIPVPPPISMGTRQAY
jgi:hypothetical protein